MLISPDEVKAKAKSKENENYAFRTYLKNACGSAQVR
jgi:hypothetical protein